MKPVATGNGKMENESCANELEAFGCRSEGKESGNDPVFYRFIIFALWEGPGYRRVASYFYSIMCWVIFSDHHQSVYTPVGSKVNREEAR